MNSVTSDSEGPAVLSQDDLRQLDLLIDGELEPAEQKRLLARVDKISSAEIDEPWRQVALAYVESQAWRSDFCATRDDAPSPVAPAKVARIATKRPVASGPQLAKVLLAMAASALLAFGAGYYVNNDKGDAATDVAASPEKEPAATEAVAQREVEPIMVPIFVNDNGGKPFGDPTQPVMPLHLIEALEQAGQPMQPGRTLVPIQMEDGTELSMPVAELKLRLEETSRRVESLREKYEQIDNDQAKP